MSFHLKIFHKLFFTLLFLSGAALLLMALFMRWSLDRGFLDYVNNMEEARKEAIISQLRKEYLEMGSWDDLAYDRRRWRRMTSNAGAPPLATTPVNIARPSPPEDGFRPEPRRPRGENRRRGGGRRGDVPRGDRGRGPRGDRGGPPLSDFDALLDPIFEDYHSGPGNRPPPPDHDGPPPRTTLFDAEKNVVVGPHHLMDQQNFTPIEIQGRLVGWLGVVPLKEVVASNDVSFLKQQSRAMYGFMISLLIITIFVSLFLTRLLLKPVKALARGARKLSSGRFKTRLPIPSKDEIGELTADFNNLAHTLAENKETRQRWVADISHELRTPLAVLRGELEALQDGVRRWTPDAASSLHSEVMGLNKLVDDLYELSLADIGALKYHKRKLNPMDVLENCTDLLQHRFSERGLALVSGNQPRREPHIFGDEQRLRQLFTNILENSSRYTDAGGQCHVTAKVKENRLIVTIEDTSPGISKDKCEQLFERFFRTDTSRARKFGGAGLGLAICRKIVEAHEGVINAEPSQLGGLRIRMSFPLHLSG